MSLGGKIVPRELPEWKGPVCARCIELQAEVARLGRELESVTKRNGSVTARVTLTNAQRQKAYRERRKAAAIVGRTET